MFVRRENSRQGLTLTLKFNLGPKLVGTCTCQAVIIRFVVRGISRSSNRDTSGLLWTTVAIWGVAFWFGHILVYNGWDGVTAM